MIQNYFKLALRNLLKRRGYSFLNLAGLTIGMVCCLLILQYVLYERSYDGFVTRAGDIYRLRLDCYQKNELAWRSATVYPAYGPTLLRDFPEIEATCRLHDAEYVFANRERDLKFAERKGYFADGAFLDVFELPLRQGNRAQALEAPSQLVVSEKFAEKYFGTTEVLGKTVSANFNGSPSDMQITGVFGEFPENSHLVVDYLVSMPTLAKIAAEQGDTTRPLETSWGWYDFYTYLKLRPHTDHTAFASKMPAFTDKYMNSNPNTAAANVRNETLLQPLKSIHLWSNINQEAEPNGDGKAVGLLFAVALFILGIAWINYINLSTARAVERAREVGVRKVSGATRGQLVGQFLTESFLLNGAALILSLGIVWFAAPAFSNFLGKNMPFGLLSGAPLGWMLGIFALGTLLSGFYPALVLSGFKPVSILKGAFRTSPKGVNLRRGLIVGQFAISVAMLVGVLVVTRQVQYMRSQHPGFDRTQTLVLEGPHTLPDSTYTGIYTGFKNEILQIPGVKSIAGSSSVPGEEIYWTSGFKRLKNAEEQRNTLYILGADADFVQSYNLKMAAGRNFEITDKKVAMLNEAAAKLLGFVSVEQAVGEQVLRGRRDTFTVQGVVRDFHHEGLQKTVNPMCLLYRPDQRNYYSLKISGSDLPATLARVESIWKNRFPADPYSYFFLDEFFDRQYKADVLFGKVFGMFTLLAIFIACLGLFGLASYMVLQRNKEIGIRKVLGASVAGITGLLAKDFLKLVVVAIVIASPLAWWGMNKWLSDFAYRIDLQWWMFALAGAAAAAVAFLTVSFQSVKAALANPVNSLRAE
ncbi:MAG TPA: ABC transporter permease [Saprospiraceae bacterium]|nr:ABC transporter permease [Saprospiraceae bacterium]